MPLRYLQPFESWLKTRPALLCGLSTLISAASAFYSPAYLLALLLLPLFVQWKKALFLLAFCGAFFFWCLLEYPSPQTSLNGVEGIAHIAIDRLSKTSRNEKGRYLYQGRIKSFWIDPDMPCKEVKNFPCFFSLAHDHPSRPSADGEYLVRCTLKSASGSKIALNGIDQSSWEAIAWTYSLAEWRFQAKSAVNRFIQSRFHTPSVQSFLSGILTGEFDDRELFQAFKELGLIHLLAISGFHFSLIASLGAFVLGLFLPERLLRYPLILLLCGYFLFLGWGPSVLRAWMAILIFYSASFFHRFSDSGNALGAALFFSLWIDPPLVTNIGFQFSFLTTAAILFIHPLVQDKMAWIFPRHSLQQALQWPITTKQAYLVFQFWLSQISLAVATTAFTLPLSIVIFGSFPSLGLLYNLFYPSLVSISVSLLLLGLLLSPVPFIPQIIHGTNDYFTAFLLNMTKN